MKNSEYKNNTNLSKEINNILSNISVKQTEVLINQIILAIEYFSCYYRVNFLYNVSKDFI